VPACATPGASFIISRRTCGSRDTHVLIVGYQGEGSLGRRLVNGEKVVSIHGEKIAVAAKVHTLGGFSAHAGQTDLLHWFSALAPAKPRVVLTHGEDVQRSTWLRRLSNDSNSNAPSRAWGKQLKCDESYQTTAHVRLAPGGLV
jgi:predicted metal-dependent RNase